MSRLLTGQDMESQHQAENVASAVACAGVNQAEAGSIPALDDSMPPSTNGAGKSEPRELHPSSVRYRPSQGTESHIEGIESELGSTHNEHKPQQPYTDPSPFVGHCDLCGSTTPANKAGSAVGSTTGPSEPQTLPATAVGSSYYILILDSDGSAIRLSKSLFSTKNDRTNSSSVFYLSRRPTQSSLTRS